MLNGFASVWFCVVLLHDDGRNSSNTSSTNRLVRRMEISFVFASIFLTISSVKKLEEQPADGLVLLLLHPVSSSIQKMNATHLGAGLRPHDLDGASALIWAPITLPRDERRWNIDGTAGKQLKLGGVPGISIDAIRVQAALESGPPILRAVHAQFFFRKPLACRGCRCGRHFRRHGLRHAFVQVHHVVAWKLGHLAGGVGRERKGLVLFPVRALEVIVSAQEIMDTLRRVPHVLVRRTRRIVRSE